VLDPALDPVADLLIVVVIDVVIVVVLVDARSPARPVSASGARRATSTAPTTAPSLLSVESFCLSSRQRSKPLRRAQCRSIHSSTALATSTQWLATAACPQPTVTGE
jgi:hypothetical protein